MFWVNPDDYMFYTKHGRKYSMDSPMIDDDFKKEKKEGTRLTTIGDVEKELETRFNKLGSLGWELVGTVLTGETHRIVCFKRELG